MLLLWLLELLQEWWLVSQPMMWLFPGCNPLLPIMAHQLYHMVHEMAATVGIKKQVSPHMLRHSSPCTFWSKALTSG
jgi:integrase